MSRYNLSIVKAAGVLTIGAAFGLADAGGLINLDSFSERSTNGITTSVSAPPTTFADGVADTPVLEIK